jgi:hypothetical protein
MTGGVQRPSQILGHPCTRPLNAATSALSDIPPFGGAAGDVSIAPDRGTAFASSHPIVTDVKKGQSGDVYYR